MEKESTGVRIILPLLSRNNWEVLPNTAPCSVDLPSWYNVLFGVRIKRRSIQLALLFPILFPYFLLSSIRIWRAQNLDSYLYHFTHILEHWTCYIARTQSYQSRTNKHISNNHVHGPLSSNNQQWTLLYACSKYRRFENTHILTFYISE